MRIENTLKHAAVAVFRHGAQGFKSQHNDTTHAAEILLGFIFVTSKKSCKQFIRHSVSFIKQTRVEEFFFSTKC